MKRMRNAIGRFDSTPTGTVLDRFEAQFSRVSESGCWVWTGSNKSQFGYGAFKIGNRASKVEYAHRAAWSLYVGEIPKGMCVCHSCDVSSCVNPDHLFLGTAKDNSDDKVRKGRAAIGDMLPITKLTKADAIAILSMKDKPKKVLAEMFNISRQSVSDIIHGRTWKHVSAAS